MLPGVFQPTLFSRQVNLRPSRFIRPIHPKTEIRPTAESIRKILDAGWLGQMKIHGHRAQIHVSSDPQSDILVYNRQGHPHQKVLPPVLASEIRRLFTPKTQWNVIDAEWMKDENKIFVFDFLKFEGNQLHRLNFLDRWKYLPRAYISPAVQTLGVLTRLEDCMEVIQRAETWIEGLVFKSPSIGFEDSSIIRCRKALAEKR